MPAGLYIAIVVCSLLGLYVLSAPPLLSESKLLVGGACVFTSLLCCACGRWSPHSRIAAPVEASGAQSGAAEADAGDGRARISRYISLVAAALLPTIVVFLGASGIAMRARFALSHAAFEREAESLVVPSESSLLDLSKWVGLYYVHDVRFFVRVDGQVTIFFVTYANDGLLGQMGFARFSPIVDAGPDDGLPGRWRLFQVDP